MDRVIWSKVGLNRPWYRPLFGAQSGFVLVYQCVLSWFVPRAFSATEHVFVGRVCCGPGPNSFQGYAAGYEKRAIAKSSLEFKRCSYGKACPFCGHEPSRASVSDYGACRTNVQNLTVLNISQLLLQVMQNRKYQPPHCHSIKLLSLSGAFA